MHPNDRAREAEVFQQAIQEGSGHDIEYRLIGPHQSISYIHETSQPEFDQAGQFVGNFGTWQNITERRQAEEGLRESERRLRTATKMAKLGYFAWDLIEDRCTYCSEEYARVHGMSVEEYMASVTTLESDSQLVHPDDRARYNSALKEALEGRTPFELEYRILGADGQVRHVREREVLIEDKDGVDILSEGTVQDMTDIRNTEDKLHESEQRYRELFDDSPIAIWVEDWSSVKQMLDDLALDGLKDLRGYFNNHRDQLMTAYDSVEVLEISRATLDLYHEESKEDILGRSAAGIVVEEELDAFLEIALSFLSGQMAIDIEAGDVTGDGLEIFVRRRVVIPPKYYDDWSRVIYAVEDISLLREYTRKLEVSNRELHDFANVASHDLQEPLRKIEAFGGRLSQKYADDLPDQAQDFIDRMENAARRMRSLIDDLLNVSRVTTNAKPFKRTDLSNVLEGVLSDLQIRIEETDADIVVGDLPTIDADQTQMRQLLQNLIGNALKFAKPGRKPVVSIKGEFVSKEEASHSLRTDLYRLTITDNGIGFDNKLRDKIFVIFQRLHGRRDYEGTGIGLATCRKIVERHGGSIEADGRPDEGATFTVTLPSVQRQCSPSAPTGQIELIA
jgi:PAS domain S-box-containing protein